MIIFDWNGTLVMNDAPVEGALELRAMMKGAGVDMAVVSRCTKGEAAMEKRVERITAFMKPACDDVSNCTVHVTDGERLPLIKEAMGDRRYGIIIGDRVRKEIRDANLINQEKRHKLFTIWVRGGRFPDEYPTCPDEVPDLIVPTLRDLVSGVWGRFLNELIRDLSVFAAFR